VTNRRRIGFALVGLGLGLLVTLGLIEISFRVLRPVPRAQIVDRAVTPSLRLAGGVPVWEMLRTNAECARERPRARVVTVYGDSILGGWSIPDPVRWSSLVQARLDRDFGPVVCLINHAQPGFGTQAEIALATETHVQEHPTLVYWELWDSGTNRYAMLGQRAFNTAEVVTDKSGLPNPFRVPQALNAALLHHSFAWQYASLGLLHHPGTPDEVAVAFGEKLRATVGQLRSTGSPVVMVWTPTLTVPFAGAEPPLYLDVIAQWTAADGVPTWKLKDSLAHDDVVALRMDSCHYNTAGHARLAELFYADIVDRLGL
jgi:hypothetical protein